MNKTGIFPLKNQPMPKNRLLRAACCLWPACCLPAACYFHVQDLPLHWHLLRRFYGTLPRAWGEVDTWPQLQNIYLNDNNLTGTLPVVS